MQVLPLFMLQELRKYKDCGSFMFDAKNPIGRVCNAPRNKAGIYVIYAVKNGVEVMVYIGRSGKLKMDGSLFIRKGGLWDRLVNGKRDGEPRRNYWMREMAAQRISALKICWFATHAPEFTDCPEALETLLINKYRPTWNR
jgi:hypothetical protein